MGPEKSGSESLVPNRTEESLPFPSAAREVFLAVSEKGKPCGATQENHPEFPTDTCLGLLFCQVPWHTPYHFHKLGLASDGYGGQTSLDTDTGFLGEADRGHNPSSFGHGVASCSYEPAKGTQEELR